jgi:hypothetical protein
MKIKLLIQKLIMRAFAIQSDSRLVITTNQDVAIVTNHFLLKKEKIVTTQESNLIHDFELKECKLIHVHEKLISIEAKIKIGEEMEINSEALIGYDSNIITLSNLNSSYLGFKVQNDTVDDILKPLILRFINNNYKQEIQQFYGN